MLAGYVGAEPNIVVGKNDFKVVRISIGTSTFRNKQTVTDWHNVEAFGSAANYIEKYVKKGDYVVVSGFLTMSKFKGKDGSDRNYYNVKVSTVEKPRVRSSSDDNPGEEYEMEQGKPVDDMPY